MKIRAMIAAMVIILTGFILSLPAVGVAEFPDKPIQVLVGWPAGSMNDMVDRAITQELQKILKQPVIIQNVPGGGGALVCGRVKTVKADGYTLFQTGSPMYSRTPHPREVPFDPLKDFAYLAQHAWFQYVLEVRSDSPWKTFEELISYVKENPKKVRYSTPGMGGSQHVIMEYLAMRDNLQWIHVPFNASTEQLMALLGGHVELNVVNLGPEMEQLRAGTIRILISLNPKRIPLFPDIPSILEKGYDFAIVSGACWAVPAGTPKDIQRKLESALLQAMKEPPAVEVIKKWNFAFDPLDSVYLTKMIENDYRINGELLKKFGLGIYKKD
jgi:tripartite-type tricarboxylate transporter receptor subunit TctC